MNASTTFSPWSKFERTHSQLTKTAMSFPYNPQVLALPFEQSQAFVLDSSCSKSPGLMFGVVWAYNAILNGTFGSANGTKTQPLELRPVATA